MKQHPIPQDITNYRFHLIGSMTLKQFAEVAGASIVALIIHSTNLPGIFKWPLIIFVIILGLALAFLPIEERPLDHWISTFFKNLYKPTKFYWKKENKIPEFFSYKKRGEDPDFITPDIDLNPARKARIYEYLKSIPLDESEDPFEKAQTARAQNILAKFDDVEVNPQEIDIEKQDQKPTLKTRVRKLKNTTENEVAALSMSPGQNDLNIQIKNENNLNLSSEQFSNRAVKATQEITLEEKLATQQIDNSPKLQTVEPEIAVAEVIKEKPLRSEVIEENVTQPGIVKEITKNTENNQEKTGKKLSQFNDLLSLPIKETIPNKISGVVLDQNDQIIPGALVEVIDEDGRSCRVVKSNPLGQFSISTPLENAEYQIMVEAEGKSFAAFPFKTTGKIIPPIEIRSAE